MIFQMNSVEKQAVLRTWKELVRSIDIHNVIDVLIEQRVVSFEDVELIRNGDTKPEQSRRLVFYFKKRRRNSKTI